MNLSELRQDPVSGDWIVIAKGRKARPHDVVVKRRRKPVPLHDCPFETPEGKVLFEAGHENDWRVRVVENKFPAFTHPGVCAEAMHKGMYTVAAGVGHHEIVITRDHEADFPQLSLEQAGEVFAAFIARYRALADDTCLAYISLFHNWGASAGASVYHPHYQIIAIPVIPPDVWHSLEGSKRYFEKHKECVHCAMIAQELKEQKRIIFENAHAIAVTPFVSRQGFEVRVFPKAHQSFFEETNGEVMAGVAHALKESIQMMRHALGDPDYNFFIHTASLKEKEDHAHYHWHIEILPKVNIAAGFELGTGIEINPLDPDEAAEMLRNG